MKKIILSLLLVFALSSSVFAESFDIPTKLVRITSIPATGTNYVYLVYDNSTKIVYFYSGLKEMSVSPYYSPNGKLCRYDEINKKLVEVE